MISMHWQHTEFCGLLECSYRFREGLAVWLCLHYQAFMTVLTILDHLVRYNVSHQQCQASSLHCKSTKYIQDNICKQKNVFRNPLTMEIWQGGKCKSVLFGFTNRETSPNYLISVLTKYIFFIYKPKHAARWHFLYLDVFKWKSLYMNKAGKHI